MVTYDPLLLQPFASWSHTTLYCYNLSMHDHLPVSNVTTFPCMVTYEPLLLQLLAA